MNQLSVKKRNYGIHMSEFREFWSISRTFHGWKLSKAVNSRTIHGPYEPNYAND